VAHASPAARVATLKRLLGLARPELGALIAGSALLALGSGMALLYPQGIRVVIDAALSGRAIEKADQAAALLAGVALVQGLAVAGRYWFFTLAGERGTARLRTVLFERVLAQEIAFFDASRTGELTSRLSSDTTLIQHAVTANLSAALRNAIQAIGAVALLLYTSPRLTAVMLAIVPPVALGAVWYGRRVRRLSREVQDALASANEVAEESIAGVRTVRLFDAEASAVGRYATRVQDSYRLALRRGVLGAGFIGGATVGIYGTAAVLLWYGARLVASGALTPGQLTSFLVYTLMIAIAVGALADVWAELMKALGVAQRVFELVDRAPALPEGGAVPPSVRGEVAFEDVHFAYPARPDLPVLRGVTLTVHAGERLALVGASGAGKSTLVALLARLYEHAGGRGRLDGRDVRELDARWLRRHIGVVSQEPILFATTIRENIRYARPDASAREVEDAARAANAEAFIMGFPEGYETAVGERGVQLSGGQKQRIAIARALLKDPPILVLDEATSALDAESEHLVQQALERLERGRTTLVIAHRLVTVISADRVAVLGAGRVEQLGTHAALSEQEGLYRRLVERQLIAAPSAA
jgi:ATP-binding cassette subfamily B protein